MSLLQAVTVVGQEKGDFLRKGYLYFLVFFLFSRDVFRDKKREKREVIPCVVIAV